METVARLQLANEVRELSPVLDKVEALLSESGADEQVIFRVRLALDELVTNSIVHGFPEGGRHIIRIDLAMGQDEVAVKVSDDGKPFNPLLAPNTAPAGSIEEREIGGVGLYLVKQLIPDLSYRHFRGRNVVSLRSPRWL